MAPRPQTLTAVTPNSGTGLLPVLLVGGTFVNVPTTVTFGGVPALDVNVMSGTQISCVTPEVPAGAVTVVVTQHGQGAPATLVNGFTFTTTELVNVSYTFQAPSGAPLAYGTVTFRLSTDAMVLDNQISAGRLVKAALDSTGSCTVALWANSQMTPAGTVYIVKAYTALGQLVWEGTLTASDTTVPSFLLLESTRGLHINFILLEDGGQIELE